MTVFASEVIQPPKKNGINGYLNDSANKIITLQHTDGTTVTNLLTGATGETFDSPNLIGLANHDGAAVSATWEVSKPDNVDDDPFALCETEQQVQDEYQLVTNGTGYGVTNEVFTDSITDDVLTLEFEASNLQNNQPIFSIAESVAASRIFYIFVDAAQNKLMGYFGTSANVTLSTIIDLTDNHEYKITYDGVNNTVVVLQDDIDVSSGDSANSVTPTGLSAPMRFFVRGDGAGGVATPSVAGVAVKYFRFSNVTQGYVHSISFNRTFGTVIESDTSDLKATLVNFDEEMGSVRAFGVSDGLDFDSTKVQYATIPEYTFAANDEILLTFIAPTVQSANYYYIVDAPATYVSGNRPYLYVNGVSHRFEFDSAVMDVEYDGNPIASSSVVADADGQTHTIKLIMKVGGDIGTIGSRFNAQETFNSSMVSVAINNLYYYDFARITDSKTLPEIINGVDGTLVNFSDVYVPEKNKTLVGQWFNGVDQKVNGITFVQPTGKVTFTVRMSVDEITDSVQCSGKHDSDRFYMGIHAGAFVFALGTGFVPVQTVLTPVNGKMYTLVGTHDFADNAYTFSVDGQEVGSGFKNVNVLTYLDLASSGSSNFHKGVIEYASFVDDSNSNNNRYLDLSIEAGSTIVDTSGNENHGTVVGGDLRRVYSYSGYGEIAGFKTPNRKKWSIRDATLPTKAGLTVKYFLVGDISKEGTWKRLFSTSDNICRIYTSTGGSNDVLGNIINPKINDVAAANLFDAKAGDVISFEVNAINNGVYHYFGTYYSGDTESTGAIFSKIEVWDGATQIRNYDGTTGDIELTVDSTVQPAIKETIGGYHATFYGVDSVETSGFMPVLEKFVFTDFDYVDHVAFGIDRKSESGYQVYQFSGIKTPTAQFDLGVGDFPDGAMLEGVGNDFVGNFDDTSISTITDTLMSESLIDDNTSRVTYKNMMLLPVNYALFTNSSLVHRLERVGIKRLGNTALYLINASKDMMIKDCSIISDNSRSLYLRYGNAKIINSLVEGSYVDAKGIVRARDCDIDIINSTINNIGSGAALGQEDGGSITGSNNFTNDATAANLGVGTQVDFTNAFNADGSISQTWYDSSPLKGGGWNGTDAVSWAVAETPTEPPIGDTFKSHWIINYSGVI